MSLQQLSKGLRITKEKIFLPSDIATWVIAILAQREAGKTYTVGDLVEEFSKHNIPFVLIDPLGIHWGLKYRQKIIEKPDGEKEIQIAGPGLPILVFGGKYADRNLTLETVPALVKTLVETNLSCVLDVSELADNGLDLKIVSLFLRTIAKENNADRQIILEEADLFCPENIENPAQQESRTAVNNLVVRAGNSNLGCVLVSQRSASVAKKALTQANCLIILRTTAPQDIKVIRDWVSSKVKKEDPRIDQIINTLDRLENGEGYIYKPTKPDPIILEHVHFRERETLHSTREWKRQLAKLGSQAIPTLDLAQQLAQFDKTFQSKSKLGPFDLFTPEQLKKLIIERDNTYQAALKKIGDLNGQIDKLNGKVHELESAPERVAEIMRGNKPPPNDPVSGFGFSDQEVLALKDLASAQISHAQSGGTGVITFNNLTPSTFDIVANRAQEPPKEFSTDNKEGKLVWVLLSKYKGKPTEYKPIREEVDRIWGNFTPSDMTLIKKSLADKRIILDDSKRIRANFGVGKILVDGKELISEDSSEEEI